MIHEYAYIKDRLNTIQTFLESPYEAEGAILMDRLAQLDAYIAEAGKLKADAEYYLNVKLQSEILQQIQEQARVIMTPTVMNRWIKSLAADC